VATVAVIVPSFNHASYIAAAVNSALRQTLPPTRVVVVDDGSTDGSADVIRGVGDPRIELIVQQNAGAHAALNRGIAAAGDADYVAILNSDDIYEPARLERCVAVLEGNRNVEAVCTALRFIDADGRALPPENPKARRLAAVWEDPKRDPAEWLGIANFAKTTSNFVIRTAYARAHPFRDYRYVHDYFFAVAAALEGKLGVLPEPLLRYRTHGSNTIKSDGSSCVAREILRMNLDLFREFAGPLGESADLRAALTRYFRTLSGNHSDFRLEVFLATVAKLAGGIDSGELQSTLGALDASQFPELAAPAGDGIRRASEAAGLWRFRQAAVRSRWLAFGRAFGFTPDLFAGETNRPDKELARLKKALDRSFWFRLGRILGAISLP